MPSRPYKDLVIYGCFVLNRLVADMGIDLYQDGLESKLEIVLPSQRGSPWVQAGGLESPNSDRYGFTRELFRPLE
ncbi:MAG: hypothetical protein E6K15_03475 [Methanobacteriota archaeon]|nr:MAG: hypothetical protein E6K15_03475 [Euryarchaeota archaeon]